jgi:hypothetical protein
MATVGNALCYRTELDGTCLILVASHVAVVEASLYARLGIAIDLACVKAGLATSMRFK